ncbi:hypothetical protein BC939DRAFT_121340 [Gamsiella multidivaricata]|uniref:uncharacterized protein n=1 Tax=Gamsiella multidivaricata TaxID=101098 RepID=UPI00221E5895|nr:uncharacterized protein BC939DRAFT_121340 [Gamsiella multidivaricata]KAG0360633.1 hypothetical protein BGZ54_009458 [Gamsiella multidivaricata]KAI7825615.1 hypothetical protein BC939DRAFT_121340 [Gamsiella multidivaricata]
MVMNPLEIPEILFLVGQYIPLWDFDECDPVFQPRNLLPFLSVSCCFRRTLLPVFWHTVDGYVMGDVPLDVLHKYAPHARVFYYRSQLDDFFVDTVPPYRQLIELHAFGSYRAMDLARLNPNLQEFVLVTRIPVALDETIFVSLKQLRRLHLSFGGDLYDQMDHISFPNVLRLIPPTLESLTLSVNVFGVACQGQVGFPKLKTLGLRGDPGRLLDRIPLICPNLETIEVDAVSDASVESLKVLFRSGACPRLVNWSTTVVLAHETQFAEILSSHRQGIKELDMRLREMPKAVQSAIKQHGDTLKSLSVRNSTMRKNPTSSLVDILRTCSRLEEFEYENWYGHWDVGEVMDTTIWKNPGLLKSLAFRGNWATVCNMKIGDLTLSPPDGETTKTLARTSIRGWRVQKEKLEHNRAALEALFELAEGFEQLKVITLNRATYKKCH